MAMIRFFYAVVSLLALGVLWTVPTGTLAPRVAADTAAAPAAALSVPVSGVQGDLVIDFMGAQRGYVEPCG